MQNLRAVWLGRRILFLMAVRHFSLSPSPAGGLKNCEVKLLAANLLTLLFSIDK